jgi:protein gp37
MKKIYRRFGKHPDKLHAVDKERSANLGSGNTIFVCSSCDMFADTVDNHDIRAVIKVCDSWPGKNTYLFHTKNPLNTLLLPVRDNFILCATIESNYWHDMMGKAPSIESRFLGLHGYNGRKMITIEPVMDFCTAEFVKLIMDCGPIEQVNIGADSGNNHLPEPSPEKIADLIEALRRFTRVHLKKNLKRLYKEAA